MSNQHAKRGSTDSLTPMQAIVVQEVRRGLSWTAAARAAGYADPSGEVDRLKANTAIVDAVVGTLQEKAASWELLAVDVRRVLSRNMSDGHSTWCRSSQPPHEEHGWAPCNCWFDKLRPSDANTAARITADILGRTDREALAVKAKREDAAITDKAAAEAYLGFGIDGEAVPSEEKDESIN